MAPARRAPSSALSRNPPGLPAGTPVLIKDVATVALGPEMRRGIADYNGKLNTGVRPPIPP